MSPCWRASAELPPDAGTDAAAGSGRARAVRDPRHRSRHAAARVRRGGVCRAAAPAWPTSSAASSRRPRVTLVGAAGGDRARPARADRRGAPRRRGDGGGVLRRQRAVDAGARRGARRGAVHRCRARADGDRLPAGDGQEVGRRSRARDQGADRLSGARALVVAPPARARRRRRAGDRHLPRAELAARTRPRVLRGGR